MEDKEAIKKESADRLKRARAKTSHTLASLAKATNGELSTSRIANYEAGVRMMPVECAITLGELLGVTAAYLLGVDETSGSASDGLNKSQEKLLKLLSKVSDAGEDEIEFVTFVIKAYLVHKSR